MVVWMELVVCLVYHPTRSIGTGPGIEILGNVEDHNPWYSIAVQFSFIFNCEIIYYNAPDKYIKTIAIWAEERDHLQKL